MNQHKFYDVCITGGGLAGLSLSILLSGKGYKVALLEKEKYPLHRLCGEYISMESWPFLLNLGLQLDKMELPRISKLEISSPSGIILKSNLDTGGFGISRHFLDEHLSILAKKNGVDVFENTKVKDIQYDKGQFNTIYDLGTIQSKMAIAAAGKRSNLDINWSRNFIKKKPSKLNNYIGVKYHVTTDIPSDTISLHNFENGYCGVSKVEGNKYCVCYLTTAENLKKSNNSIEQMENDILQKNPLLEKLFKESVKINTSPITISQISFDIKSLVEKHIIMLGDAAGMITPLCGNGMSMAFRSAQIIFDLSNQYLSGNISYLELEGQYKIQWNNEFSNRLKLGRVVQSLFGKSMITNIFISVMKKMPFFTKLIIKNTHGKTF